MLNEKPGGQEMKCSSGLVREDSQPGMPMEQRIYHMWDHPISSASISRDYVRTLLEKRNKNKGFAFTGRDKPGFRPEFLPLTYLAKILSDIEEQ
ncbi:gamma-secretase-activating protein isoform X1, partial [Lates japonicus]